MFAKRLGDASERCGIFAGVFGKQLAGLIEVVSRRGQKRPCLGLKFCRFLGRGKLQRIASAHLLVVRSHLQDLIAQGLFDLGGGQFRQVLQSEHAAMDALDRFGVFGRPPAFRLTMA